MSTLGFFLMTIVMGLILALYVLARYSQFDNEIKNRSADLEEKEEKTQQRLEALSREIQDKKIDLKTTEDRIESIKREIDF